MLFSVDAILLTVHAIHLVLRRWGAEQNALSDFLLNTAWNGSNDGSVGEIWGYLQLGAAGLILLALSLRGPRRYAFAMWGVVFLVMTADDMLRLHENFAERFESASRASPVMGIPPYAFGQLLFWGVLAVLLGGLLLLAHSRSSVSTRRGSVQLLAGTVLLSTAAVGVDLGSSLALEIWGRTAHSILVFIEAVGELVFVTVILVVALRLVVLHSEVSAPKSH